MTGRYNIRINKGETFSRQFTWKRNGSAVDVTGYSARLDVRTAAGGTAFIQLTSSAGDITLGGTAGTVTVNISASSASSLDTDNLGLTGVYDLELVTGATVVRLIEGDVIIVDEVTA